MLDFDLAEMYGTETKRLKEAVKRNIRRFPSDFMFELTKDEYIFFEVANCVLKESRWNPLHALCVYRTWRSSIIFYLK